MLYLNSLLVFGGGNCPACERAKADIGEKENVSFIDCYEFPGEATRWDVMSRPTIILLEGGIGTKRWVGWSRKIHSEVMEAVG